MEEGGGGDKVGSEVVDDIAQLELSPVELQKPWGTNSFFVFNIIRPSVY